MKNYIGLAFAASLFLCADAMAGGAAAPYENSSIDARLNVTVKSDTDVVHFVRDNADPSVFTKAYVIKHVDPYELRSYLRSIVQTRKVDGDNTNVEAVKFTDGTSILLVSAEDYRFADQPGAQGIDSIIRELDQPKLVSSSGRKTYVYSPRYRSSLELMEMVSAIGAYSKDPVMNNVGGNDVLINDPGLNLIFFNTAPFSRKTIGEVLADYDKPYPQIRAKITVYELYAENDTKLGLDFQSWKNNEGIDLFSAGGRFASNHNGIDLVRNGGWNNTSYFQFNPKWNTKYIDFLTSKGKAKVVHTSELMLRNNVPASISKLTSVFTVKMSPAGDHRFTEAYAVSNFPAGAVVGRDRDGVAITLTAAADVTVIKLGKGTTCEYTLRVDRKGAARFVAGGKELGVVAEADSISAAVEANMTYLAVGPESSDSVVSGTKASDAFGFTIDMTPSINTKATTLNVKITNSSLIGYNSDGSPRIQKSAGIDSNFTIANEGTKLVIGGIEKRSVVQVSGGVPFLKDLPLLGWIFSTESESTKRSQLLVVAELLPEAAADSSAVVGEVKQKLVDAGEKNTFGYRQYLIDEDRK